MSNQSTQELIDFNNVLATMFSKLLEDSPGAEITTLTNEINTKYFISDQLNPNIKPLDDHIISNNNRRGIKDNVKTILDKYSIFLAKKLDDAPTSSPAAAPGDTDASR